MPTTVQTLVGQAACYPCLVYSDQTTKAIELILWCHLLHQTPPESLDTVDLLREARCLMCGLTGANLDAALIAVLVAIANDDRSLFCTTTDLARAARCYLSCIPVGMLPYVKVALLSRLVDSGYFIRQQIQTDESVGLMSEEGDPIVTEESAIGTNPAVSSSVTTLLELAQCWFCLFPGVTIKYIETAILLAAYDGAYGQGSDPRTWQGALGGLFPYPLSFLQAMNIIIIRQVAASSVLPDDYRITEEDEIRLTEEGDIRIPE